MKTKPPDGPAGGNAEAGFRDLAQREAHERFNVLVQKSPLAIVAIDRRGIVSDWNPAAERLFGWMAAEVVGQPLPIIADDERKQFDVLIAGEIQGEVRSGIELRRLRKDGSLVDVALWTAPLRDEKGEIIGTIATFADITERKQADESLKLAKEYAENLIQTANVMIVGLDVAGKLTVFNDAAEKISGYSRADLAGKDWFEVLVPKDRYPYVWKEFERLTQRGGVPRTFENPILTRAGEERQISWQNSELREQGNVVGTISFGVDITERKEKEAALRDHRERLRAILDTVGDPIFVKDNDHRIILANQAFYDIFALDENAVMGKTLAENVPADERQHFLEIDRRVLDTGIADVSEETLSVAGRATRIIVTRKTRFIELSGERFLVGSIHDITERKQAEDDLQRSMKELQVLYQSSLVFSELHEPEIVGKEIIETMERLLNYQRGSIWITNENSPELDLLAHSEVGLKPDALKRELARVSSLVPRLGEGISGWVALHGESIRTGEVKQEPRYVEADPATQSELCVPLKVHGRTIGSINVESSLPHAFTEHDERLLTTLTSQAAIAIENARLFHRLELDITERKLAEESLKTSEEQLRALSARLQSAREEEGTRIAREIHDELGGALTGLKWDLEGIDKVLADAGNGGRVEAVREKIPNMTGLIESTIDTLRRISAELRPGVLDDLGLVAAIEWQARQFQERTGIKCEYLAGAHALDLSQERATAVFRIFQEILTNVIRHAQATTVNVELTEHGGYLELRVRDNGRGIIAKEKHNTRSLGLLGMRERALLVGGEVSFSGEAGKGTTVIARVPVR